MTYRLVFFSLVLGGACLGNPEEKKVVTAKVSDLKKGHFTSTKHQDDAATAALAPKPATIPAPKGPAPVVVVPQAKTPVLAPKVSAVAPQVISKTPSKVGPTLDGGKSHASRSPKSEVCTPGTKGAAGNTVLPVKLTPPLSCPKLLKKSTPDTIVIAAQSLPKVLTLNAALALAYDKNFDLKMARQEFQETVNLEARVITEFFPEVKAKISNSHSRHRESNQAVPGSGYHTSGHGHTREGSLSLTQNIFSGGSSLISLKKAKLEREATEAALHSREQEILLQVMKVYVELLVARKTFTFNQQNEEGLKTIYNATEARMRAGLSTIAERESAKARYFEAMALRRDAEGEVTALNQQLNTLMGITNHTFIPVSEEDVPLPPFDFPLTLETDVAMKNILKKNPQIKQALCVEQAALKNITLAKTRFAPRINLSAVQSRRLKGPQYRDTIVGKERSGSRQNYAELRLDMEVPLVQFSNHVDKRIADNRWEKSRDKRYRLQQTVLENLHRAIVDYRSAKETLLSHKIRAESSDVALKAAKAEYKLGTKAILDVLQIQQDWIQSQIAYWKVKGRHFVAMARIQHIRGELDHKALRLNVSAYNTKGYHDRHGRDIIGLSGQAAKK